MGMEENSWRSYCQLN